MLEHTKKPRTEPTAELVELCVTVRKKDLAAAKKAIAPYATNEADEQLVDWREVFPAHGPHTAIVGGRTKEGMTQRELARQLGISPGNLSAMEHGRRPIGKDMAKRLGAILNVDYRVFL